MKKIILNILFLVFSISLFAQSRVIISSDIIETDKLIISWNLTDNGNVLRNNNYVVIIGLDNPYEILTRPNQNELRDIAIYPNPTSNYLNLSNSEITRIEIFDLSGQVIFVKQSSISIDQIDVSYLEQGLYTVKLWSLEGVSYTKFIKI